MANDVSGFGFRVRLVASKTFPAGVTISQFADDADPFDLPSMTINGSGMGVNGDLITWSTATPIQTSISVIPGSDDDKNLSILFEANRTARGKFGAQDRLTLTGIYPDGTTVTLQEGRIMSGLPGSAIASAGRIKSKTYGFVFEGLIRT